MNRASKISILIKSKWGSRIDWPFGLAARTPGANQSIVRRRKYVHAHPFGPTYVAIHLSRSLQFVLLSARDLDRNIYMAGQACSACTLLARAGRSAGHARTVRRTSVGAGPAALHELPQHVSPISISIQAWDAIRVLQWGVEQHSDTTPKCFHNFVDESWNNWTYVLFF